MIGTYALSAGYYDAYYRKAQKVRTLIKKDFEDAFKKVDVILSPVSPTPAFKVGAHAGDPVAMYLEDIFLCSQPLAGIPAISVPCGFTKSVTLSSPESAAADEGRIEGLPIGIQFMAPQFEEARLLGIGHAWEQMRPS